MKAFQGVVVVLCALIPFRPAHAQQHDPRAAIFATQGCTSCHAVRALHVKGNSDVGPDLTFAYVDVVNRYGVDLRTFLADPNGVMRLVLVSHLKLNGEARDSIANVLEEIYREHRAELPLETPPIANSAPPN